VLAILYGLLRDLDVDRVADGLFGERILRDTHASSRVVIHGEVGGAVGVGSIRVDATVDEGSRVVEVGGGDAHREADLELLVRVGNGAVEIRAEGCELAAFGAVFRVEAESEGRGDGHAADAVWAGPG